MTNARWHRMPRRKTRSWRKITTISKIRFVSFRFWARVSWYRILAASTTVLQTKFYHENLFIDAHFLTQSQMKEAIDDLTEKSLATRMAALTGLLTGLRKTYAADFLLERSAERCLSLWPVITFVYFRCPMMTTTVFNLHVNFPPFQENDDRRSASELPEKGQRGRTGPSGASRLHHYSSNRRRWWSRHCG